MVERGWDKRMKDGNKKGRNRESGFTLGRRQVETRDVIDCQRNPLSRKGLERRLSKTVERRL